MTPREIIAEAWAITRTQPMIRRWGYFSSFLETLFALKLICYQLYFAYAYFVIGESVGFFDDFIWLYDNVAIGTFITIMVVFCVLLLFEWFVPHMAEGAIIGLSAKAQRRDEVKGGLVLALYNFFPIFAIHEFLILASAPMIVTLISLVLRYISGEAKWFMISTIIFFWIFSVVLKFLFSFAQPAIVIDKVGIFESMGRSFKLIVSHLGQIMFLLLLLVVISLRILLNTLIVLIIPAIVLGLAWLLGTFLPVFLTVIIGSVVALVLIGIASYFFGYLHVFKQTVWTITYMELKRHKDLDVIG